MMFFGVALLFLFYLVSLFANTFVAYLCHQKGIIDDVDFPLVVGIFIPPVTLVLLAGAYAAHQFAEFK